ncbi:hypothetical protein NW767_004186 [Fusarium falciforme]|nr:hypothetical protein NW767_004186 [Fusarium falciforme]
MLCLNITDYGWWRCAKFGLKCLGIRPTTQGESVVILQLNWVPQQEMDPKKVMSLQGQDNDFDKMVECAKSFHSDGSPDSIHELPEFSILSGHLIHVPMPNPEAVHFKAMIGLHWAMIVVAAFCGGAVAPRLLPDREEFHVGHENVDGQELRTRGWAKAHTGCHS